MIEPAGGEQLGSAARALLDAARDGLGPDADAVRRVRAKVGASAAAGTGVALAIKLGIFGVVAALAIGAGIYTTSSRPSVPVTPAIALPVADADSAPPVVRAAPTEPPAIEMAPQSAARPHVVASAAQPAASGIDLAREVALIDAAMSALRGGDPTAALDAIHTHARETRGAGQLAEDAAAIEIEALCRLHDPTTAEKLDAFDVRFPRSAQRSRLTTVCR